MYSYYERKQGIYFLLIVGKKVELKRLELVLHAAKPRFLRLYRHLFLAGRK